MTQLQRGIEDVGNTEARWCSTSGLKGRQSYDLSFGDRGRFFHKVVFRLPHCFGKPVFGLPEPIYILTAPGHLRLQSQPPEGNTPSTLRLMNDVAMSCRAFIQIVPSFRSCPLDKVLVTACPLQPGAETLTCLPGPHPQGLHYRFGGF